jgi:hypothetical protein
MKNTNNNINLISIIYLNEFNVDLDLEICDELDKQALQFKDLTIKLQAYMHNEEFQEGCLTFTLSRKLTKQEREEIRSQWENTLIQVQFHSVPKLF